MSHPDRRQFIGGACACGLTLGYVGHAHADAGGGCYLSNEAYERLVEPTATDFGFAQTDSLGTDHAGGSGDKLFDQALAITLTRLSQTFDVLPAFSFFTEDGGPNAYSSTKVTRANRPDGSVAYGRKLLRLQLEDEEGGIAQVVGVCAHEFAHTVSRKRGTRQKLVEAGNGSVYRNELHADYLAGYFSGLRKADSPDFPAAEVAYGLYQLGDFSVGSEGHHGTPKQRGAAARAGFLRAYDDKASFDEAFESGYRFALSA